jgi:spermidine/putrescine transport system permease protein
VEERGGAEAVERHVPTDLPGVEPERHRAPIGKRVAPYLLGGPAALWLVIFFVVPLFTLLSLSLQTCDPVSLACRLTWHFGEFTDVIRLYHVQFLRSLIYGGLATAICLVVSFPLVYWIAFYGGEKKNFFLLMLLLPFFVSFVIRTLSWQFILSDQGLVLGALKSLHLLPQNYHVLATWVAVVAGIAYNFLPFTALPVYVALERIDRKVLEAARDLYSDRRTVFMKVILPLAIAAFLLTFVPAVGDFVNASILGGTNNLMIGNIVQSTFIYNSDYPTASALSTILMVAMLVGIFAYGKILGTRTIEEYI